MNLLAITLAAISYQVLGAVWYSFLFQNAWLSEVKIDPATVDRKEANRGLILSMLFAIVIAIILFFTIQHAKIEGVWHTASIGLTFAIVHGLAAATNIVFEGKTLRYFLITAGYPFVGWIIMGVIIGLF